MLTVLLVVQDVAAAILNLYTAKCGVPYSMHNVLKYTE
jgi:hypothetical protein